MMVWLDSVNLIYDLVCAWFWFFLVYIDLVFSCEYINLDIEDMNFQLI